MSHSILLYPNYDYSWGRPHGEDSVVEVPLVPLHDKLMSTTDHVKSIGLVELSNYVAAEQVASATRRHAPALGICPHVTPVNLMQR